jgi:hypothetical protein
MFLQTACRDTDADLLHIGGVTEHMLFKIHLPGHRSIPLIAAAPLRRRSAGDLLAEQSSLGSLQIVRIAE